MKRFLTVFFLSASPLFCQSNSGELRLKVVDPSGLGVKVNVHILSEANRYRTSLATSEQGTLEVKRLPYGIYQLAIEQPGFAAVTGNAVVMLDADGSADPAEIPPCTLNCRALERICSPHNLRGDAVRVGFGACSGAGRDLGWPRQ